MKGFTLKELVIVLGALVVLAVVVYPLTRPPHGQTHTGKCISRQRGISIAVIEYLEDHDHVYPKEWHGFAKTFTGTYPFALQCPSITHTGMNNISDYGFNGYLLGRQIEDFEDITHIVLMADSKKPDGL
ncbi:MAG: prepilin-type N-terminal cleavage/methylation domain-containing protein, partial [Armatimonadota bacterium]